MLWVRGRRGRHRRRGRARDGPASAPGIQPGDVLLAVDGAPVETPADVVEHPAPRRRTATRLAYTLLRLGAREARADHARAAAARQHGALLRARGGRHLHAAGRRRGAAAPAARPGDAAFLLAVRRVLRRRSPSRSAAARSARLGLLLGRRDRDRCCCRRCSCTSRWCSPSGRAAGCAAPLGARCCRCCTCRRALLGVARVVAVARGAARRARSSRVARRCSIASSSLYLVALPGRRARRCWCARFGDVALGDGAAAAALDRLGHGARRRCRSRSATRCRARSASTPSLPMELTAMPLGLVPLAFASAIVRYRLMDVEVIVKRALVYAAVARAIVALYVALLQAGERRVRRTTRDQHNWVIALLATLVVVLLAQPGEGRDPERARPRVLSRSLRLPPRAGRLRARPEQRPRPRSPRPSGWSRASSRRCVVDRMALMLADERRGDFAPIARLRLRRAACRALARRSAHRRPARRRATPSRSTIRSPRARFAAEESRVLARRRHLLLRAVRLEGRHDRRAGARPQGQRRAAQQRGPGAADRRRRPGRDRLENGRLYRQLHLKADELERLREFNENILESLDDGLRRARPRRPRSSAGTARSRALRRRARRRRSAGRSTTCSTPRFVEAVRAARARAPRRARRSTACRCVAHRGADDRAAASTSPTCRCAQHRDGDVDGDRARSSSSRTSPSACSSRSSCRSPRRWRRSACWRPASRTR